MRISDRQPRQIRFTISNAICIHEGRLRRALEAYRPPFVLRLPKSAAHAAWLISSVSTVENYEYGFFWYFYQDGNIVQFEIKLTGILSLGNRPHDGEKPQFTTP